jgi:Bacterial archaeo-eukaryotic release factor family 10
VPGHIVFKNLVAATLGPITDKRKREKLTDELQRIEAALQADLPALGRGVAFFTCPTGELWRQIALSLPLRDCAHVGSRPYIRPLARTRDEHDRFILVLLSLDRNRFFVSQIGQVEEVFEVRGERAVPKPEATRNEARVLARVAEPIRRPASAALGCARAARRIHQSPGRERTAQPLHRVLCRTSTQDPPQSQPPPNLPRGRLRNARRSKPHSSCSMPARKPSRGAWPLRSRRCRSGG